MIVRDLAAAEADLDEALTHYASIEKGLAAGLLREVVSAKEIISRFPLAWRQLGGGLRSYALHRFPYNVIYRASRGEILVVAYAHFKRRPGYWKKRV